MAGGVRGSIDDLRTCMGWETGPAHYSTNNSQGLSLNHPWPWDTGGRLPSLPSVQRHLPFKPNPSQKVLTCLKPFENHGEAIFCTKCHAWCRKIFCRKFIHNYSWLTEIEMYSVLFWLSKYCCYTRKSDLPSSRGFTGSSHHFTFCFEQHPNSI